jgi:hypothetical protein
MQHRSALVLAGLLIVLSPAAGDEVVIESPSDNRACLISLDSGKVQEWLLPIRHSAGSVPAWLAPDPGATPTKVEVSGDRTRAFFAGSGPVEQSIRYYDQAYEEPNRQLTLVVECHQFIRNFLPAFPGSLRVLALPPSAFSALSAVKSSPT